MWPRRTTRAPVFTGRSFCERQLGVRFILLVPQLATTLYPNLITQTSANANTIVQAPLMFVRGGEVIPGDYLRRAGYASYYWSSIGYDSYSAYDLYFYSGGVTPSNYGIRYNGFSVRCVALGG